MKARYYIGFGSRTAEWEKTQQLLADAQLTELFGEAAEPFISVMLSADDPRLELLRTALRTRGRTWIERREHIYTPFELRTFPLLWLGVNRAPTVDGGPRHGTQYDLTHACPACGTGAMQTSPLIVDISEFPKRGQITQTFLGEILVTNALAETLHAAEVSGLELRQARSRRDESPAKWWQILANDELPPMSAAPCGIVREDPCPVCARDGFYHSGSVPVEIAYDRHLVDPQEVPDVVWTWERFGKSVLKDPFASSSFAHPLLLVKPRVYDLLRQHRVWGLFFEPVRIVG